MRRKTDFIRKIQVPILLSAESMPIVLLLFGILAPARMWISWILPVCCTVAVGVCLQLPGNRRICGGVLGSAALILAGFLVGFLSGCWYLMLLTLLYLGVLWACLPVGGWEWYDELPPFICYIGIILFIAVQTVAVLIKNLVPGLPELIKNGITVPFLIFALLTLLLMNRNTLNSAVFRRSRASVNVRNKNRVWVLLFFLVVTVIVATPAILNGIWSAIRWIIQQLLSHDNNETPQLPIETQPPQEGGNMAADGSETTMFAKIMTWLFLLFSRAVRILAVPALIIFILFLLRKLLRKLRKMLEKVSGYMATATEDYVDEITDIRDRETVKRLRSFRNGWLTPANERKLPPGQRIRYRYGRLLRKHPEWAESHTAREKLPEETASLYEKARYSNADLTEEDAMQFASSSKRI